MTLSLNPQTLQFIEEQVKSGHYPTPESVIEAAIADMRDNEIELTDEDIAAIRESDAQAERGECMELSEVRALMAKRIPGVR